MMQCWGFLFLTLYFVVAGCSKSNSEFCLVDFPCKEDQTASCLSETTYRTLQTFDCHHSCGPGSCGGATCEEVGPVLSCPTGQVCIGQRYRGHCGHPDGGSTDGAAASLDAGTD